MDHSLVFCLGSVKLWKGYRSRHPGYPIDVSWQEGPGNWWEDLYFSYRQWWYIDTTPQTEGPTLKPPSALNRAVSFDMGSLSISTYPNLG